MTLYIITGLYTEYETKRHQLCEESMLKMEMNYSEFFFQSMRTNFREYVDSYFEMLYNE